MAITGFGPEELIPQFPKLALLFRHVLRTFFVITEMSGSKVPIQGYRGNRRIEHFTVKSRGKGVRLLCSLGQFTAGQIGQGDPAARIGQIGGQPAVCIGAFFIFDFRDLSFIQRRQTSFGTQGPGIHADHFNDGVGSLGGDEAGVSIDENIRSYTSAGACRTVHRFGEGVHGCFYRRDPAAQPLLQPCIALVPVLIQRFTLCPRGCEGVFLSCNQIIQKVGIANDKLPAVYFGGFHRITFQRGFHRCRRGFGAIDAFECIVRFLDNADCLGTQGTFTIQIQCEGQLPSRGGIFCELVIELLYKGRGGPLRRILSVLQGSGGFDGLGFDRIRCGIGFILNRLRRDSGASCFAL